MFRYRQRETMRGTVVFFFLSDGKKKLKFANNVRFFSMINE